jgi:hypothetical protein
MVSRLAMAFNLQLSTDVIYPTRFGTVSWAFAGPNSSHPLFSCPAKQTTNRQRKPTTEVIISKKGVTGKSKKLPQRYGKTRKGRPTSRRSLRSTPKGRIPNYRFNFIFHQVRDPLAAIPSLTTEIPHWMKCKSEILKVIPNFNYSVSVGEMALQIWVMWNSRLDRFPFIPIHRVEDFNLMNLMASTDAPMRNVSELRYLCAYQTLIGYNTRSTVALLALS